MTAPMLKLQQLHNFTGYRDQVEVGRCGGSMKRGSYGIEEIFKLKLMNNIIYITSLWLQLKTSQSCVKFCEIAEAFSGEVRTSASRAASAPPK